MTISSKDIYKLGYRYSWVHKHFNKLAIDTYVLIGHAQYNQYRIEDILKYISTYISYCKNPMQEAKSKEMLNRLGDKLRESYSTNN
jgi:hypothetical protein